ncbi:hypothetical protein COU61_03705 [Candidatus Pacearchaeota archaeon CG10_big_fil_rev_8_21_14_0_10_35_13]|nr:MAG: hypothetical protein COU61_03705 [Candidatus Pacearchaeota archaeon CG10_big_fil_rev_8_21_14_0_10_35_13]
MRKRKIRIARNNVTLSFVPYSEIANLTSIDKIKKILDMALDNRIIIIQGRLTPNEEASLIQSTMVLVGKIKDFKGVEIAVISGTGEESGFFKRFKEGLAKALVGDQSALTVIGPASIVKEIKRDPKKIELLLNK